jgi:hypothetical protein
MTEEPRYFVDERIGCIAVRDRAKTDPEYPGLHPDTEGVVKFWMKEVKWMHCPACGSRKRELERSRDKLEEAQKLADELNG